MKKCFKCDIEKPLTEFYKHKQMKDGRVNKCKSCNKSDVQENYKSNIDNIKEYDRKRAMLPHRVKARSEYQKTHAGADAVKRSKLKYAKINPTKTKAKNMLNNAVRDGKLFKPILCSQCLVGNKRIHGHHYDYTKPLDVIWCCPACHRKIHTGEIEAAVTFEQLQENLKIK